MKTLKKMRAAAWVSAVVMGLALPAGVQAQHKCAQGGQVTYQQTPCPGTGPARSLERDRAEAESRQRVLRPVATPPAASSVATTSRPPTAAPVPSSLPTAPSRWRCDGRRHCSQMSSCEEAKFFLANCPGVEMDGNHDGVPCEKQWCRSGW
ncbi:MAG: hypothetical protein RLZZ592_2598 [Pseudomonadota bacterium]